MEKIQIMVFIIIKISLVIKICQYIHNLWKRRKSNYLNNLVNNKELISIKAKEKSNKKGLIKDKYFSSSSIIINNNHNA